MSSAQGWIKLHRSLLEWEWYKDLNTRSLFLHLLIRANFKDNKFQGNTIKRGQLLTGINVLSLETSLSVQQLRTSLKKLKLTNEITIETSTKNSIITIVNYDYYQNVEEDQQANQQTNNKEATSQKQTNNKRVTTNKNDKNIKKEKNEKNEKEDIPLTAVITNLEKSDFEEESIYPVPDFKQYTEEEVDIAHSDLLADKKLIDGLIEDLEIKDSDVINLISKFFNKVKLKREFKANYRSYRSFMVNWISFNIDKNKLNEKPIDLTEEDLTNPNVRPSDSRDWAFAMGRWHRKSKLTNIQKRKLGI